jgi:hypothetical protein
MDRQRISSRIIIVTILFLLVSSISSHNGTAVAQSQGCHLDKTGKICGIFLRPGVRDEFKSNSTVAWSHTLDTLRGNQSGEAQRRQIIERYQDYAILASSSDSIGDLQFDIWVENPVSDIRIYVPSNFTFGFVSSGYGDATTQDKVYSVWTDITNDYQYISVRTLTGDDPIAPGWDVVEVGRMPTALSISPIPSFVVSPGLYHIRLFQMRAPFTAGLYHFKIYVDGESIGDGNFPIVIVKSSLQPAHVTGLVMLHRFAPGTNASGRVVATGTTPQGKYAEAVAYFGPEDFEKIDGKYGDDSCFRYWLFGLPAGTFELTASASGFLKTSSHITVDPGQSLTQDFVLERGPGITVTVWSKDMTGLIPWGNLWQPPYGTNDPYLPINDTNHHRDILLRLLNQYEESVGYWGSDDIDPPYGPPNTSATIDGKRDYSAFILKTSTLPSNDSYTASLTDVRGLASLRLDGHVPADSADLIEGIEAGSYKLEIYVTGYAMKEADDWQRTLEIQSASRNYTFQVDLRRTTWIMATAKIAEGQQLPVSNSTFTIVAKSPDNVEEGVVAGRFPVGAWEYTIVLEGFNGIYNNLRPITDYQDYGLPPNDYSLEVYMSDMGDLFGIHHLGIPTPGNGWYITTESRANLDIVAHTSFGTSSTSLSFHLVSCSVEFILRSIRVQRPTEKAPWTFPGAGIRVLLIDELGRVAATLDPTLYGLVQDDGTITHDPYDIDTGDPGWHGLLRVLFTGIDPGPIAALGGMYPTRIVEGKYFVNVATLGYVQRQQDSSVLVLAGMSNDLKIDLAQGAQIRVEMKFTHEDVATVFNGSVRVEVYSQDGTLVGASIYAGAEPNPHANYLAYDSSKDWKLVRGAAEGAGTGTEPQRAFISSLHYAIPLSSELWASWPGMTPSDANRLSVPKGETAAFDVFGFHWYYGGPDSRMDRLWVNGWDTTNGVAHFDSGIAGSNDALDLEGWGNFTIHVWAFDPYGPDGVFDSNGPDGIFGTEDDYTLPDAVDNGPSDFRAYSQVADIQDVQVPWGGVATVPVTLEEQPSLSGIVYWTDMYGDLRTLPWAQVIERSPGDTWTSTTTGAFKLWLSPSSHDLYVSTIGEEQLWERFEFSIVLARTGVHTNRDIVLVASGTRTPEFTTPTWAAVILLTLLLVLIRSNKRRRYP